MISGANIVCYALYFDDATMICVRAYVNRICIHISRAASCHIWNLGGPGITVLGLVLEFRRTVLPLGSQVEPSVFPYHVPVHKKKYLGLPLMNQNF